MILATLKIAVPPERARRGVVEVFLCSSGRSA